MEEPGTALVTGAAARIGRAIALDLARHGWSVAVHYHRSAEAAESVVAEIAAMGRGAVALSADLRQEAQCADLVPRCGAALGAVNCLVNNAALFDPDTIADVSPKSWESHQAINLRAPLLLSKAFAGQLAEGRKGNIVNLLDQRVWNLTPGFLSYTMSKSGLWTLTRMLAMALAPRVRVNGIGPGPTVQDRYQTAAQFARQCARTPLERGATPDEICAALQFILATPSLTGQMIAIDAGEHLGRSGRPRPGDGTPT